MPTAELTYCPECQSPLLDTSPSDENRTAFQINCPVCSSPLRLGLDDKGNATAHSAAAEASTDFIAITEACTLLSQSLVEIQEELETNRAQSSTNGGRSLTFLLYAAIPLLAGLGSILVGIARSSWGWVGIGCGLVSGGTVLLALAQTYCRRRCKEQLAIQERVKILDMRVARLHRDLRYLEGQRRILIRDI